MPRLSDWPVRRTHTQTDAQSDENFISVNSLHSPGRDNDCRFVCSTSSGKPVGSVGCHIFSSGQQRGVIVGYGDARAAEDAVGQHRTTTLTDTGHPASRRTFAVYFYSNTHFFERWSIDKPCIGALHLPFSPDHLVGRCVNHELARRLRTVLSYIFWVLNSRMCNFSGNGVLMFLQNVA